MKKLTLLIVTLTCLITQSHAQLIENFDGTGLEWTVVEGEGIWEIGTPEQSVLNSSFDGRNLLTTSLDREVLFIRNVVHTIESSPITLPDTGEDLFIEYLSFCESCSTKTQTLTIISEEDGTSIDYPTNISTSGRWVLETQNISGYAGKTVKFQFSIFERLFPDSTFGLWSIDRINLRSGTENTNIPNSIYDLKTVYGVGPNETLTTILVPTPNTEGDDISIIASSSDQSILANDDVSIVELDNRYHISIAPSTGQVGTVVVILTIDDGVTVVNKDFDLIIAEPFKVMDLDFESESGIVWRENPVSSGYWQTGVVNSGPNSGFESASALATGINRGYVVQQNVVGFFSSKVTLPEDGTIILDMVYWMDVFVNLGRSDFVDLFIIDENNNPQFLANFNTSNPYHSSETWTPLSYDISKYAGQQVAVLFQFNGVWNQPSSSRDGFFADNLRINAYNNTPVANSKPTISALEDIVLFNNEQFNLLIDTYDREQSELELTVTSDNQSFIADEDILITDRGFTKVLSLFPSGQGTATISLTVSDGELSSSTSFKVINEPPSAATDAIVVSNLITLFTGVSPIGTINEWEGVTLSENNRVTALDIAVEKVASIPAYISLLSELEALTLSNGSLNGSIPKEIGQLQKLKNLDLNSNSISGTIPEELFDLVNLESLNLFSNEITGPLPDKFDQLTLLKNLDFEGLALNSNLPMSIGNMPNLETLNLSNSSIVGELPDNLFANLPLLKTLLIGQNTGIIGTFPSSLFNLESLTNLEMQNIRITALPENIGNLSSLVNWDLRTVPITSLPTSIGTMSSLRTLNMSLTSFNFSSTAVNIAYLPDEIGQLVNLNELNISSIGLKEIPSSIGQLINLKELDIRNNDISSLPEGILNLTLLEDLNVSINNLETLPDFSDLINLRNIDVRFNDLEFDDLEPIELLELSRDDYNGQSEIGNIQVINLEEGEPVTISQNPITGSANSYQWYKDGVLLTDATNTELSLNNVTLNDAGDYTIEVTNSIASEETLTSLPIKVFVNESGNTINEFDDTVVSILESAVRNSTIIDFPATDDDGDAFFYEIISNDVNDGQFNFRFITRLRITSVPDFDETPQYNLVILQSDARGATNEINVTVNILEDTATEEIELITFEEGFNTTLEIPENIASGTEITQVPFKVSEQDAVLTYSLSSSGNEQNAFAIDALTGIVTIDNEDAIDFETNSSFEIFVSVSCTCDDGNSVALIINVIDDPLEEFNFAPVLVDQTFIVDGAIGSGEEIGQIIATDKDEDPLTYTVINGNEEGIFNISSTGFITIENSTLLDFDTNEEYHLNVSVEDTSGRASLAIVTIKENDTTLSNDNIEEEISSLISFYPNPVESTLYIRDKTGVLSNIIISNLDGKTVLKTSDVKNEINIEHLQSGVYFVSFVVDNELITRKLIKK